MAGSGSWRDACKGYITHIAAPTSEMDYMYRERGPDRRSVLCVYYFCILTF